MCTLFLFDPESLNQELIDVLRLRVTKIRTEVFHEFDDAMFPEVLVRRLLEGVVRRHISYIKSANSQNQMAST